MHTRTAAVLAGLVCCAGSVVVPPASQAAPPHAAGWTITRTGRGPAVLTGRYNGSAGSATSTAVLFALSGRGRERKLNYAFTTARIDWGADGWPRVYGGLQPDCQVACSDPIDTPFYFDFSSNGHKIDATVYIATWDVKDVTVEVTSPGWRVRKWTPAMRTVRSDQAGDVGIRALHTSAGRFTGAEAPGGRYGSIGWTRLPCENYGQGKGTFTGGRRARTLECGHWPSALEEMPAATRWKLAGEAVGMSASINLLVVVDFPAERQT